MAEFLPQEIIKKKRQGEELTYQEMKFLMQEYVRGEIPDYQLSAWLMAVYFQGMTQSETSRLTQVMIESGERVDFSYLGKICVDKHSTGGVGDKTSLILAPIVACAGVPVPMISGRGLGHTGGTLDKLESIPGFNVRLNLEQFRQITEKELLCFIGQTKEICPADQKLYALRDVTATIESFPLICSSIMSKKIAEGIRGLVLDVKFGSGAFMKTLEQAEKLALQLMRIGKDNGLTVAAMLTNMNQPLGRFAGNSVEIEECLAIMKNQKHLVDGHDYYSDVRELSLDLSAWMIWIGQKAATVTEARSLAVEILESGAAYKKFEQICKIQGGRLNEIPQAAQSRMVISREEGFVSQMMTEKIGLAAIHIGAGRQQSEDGLDPTAGIEMFTHVGARIKRGSPLFRIFNQNENGFLDAEKLLQDSVKVSAEQVKPMKLIEKILEPMR
jgi:pyrimidine-nucleoside phosphorylase